MWEFISHKFVQPQRWTWVRVSETGQTIQQSPAEYDSFGTALSDAKQHGFDRAEDKFVLIELEQNDAGALGILVGIQGTSADNRYELEPDAFRACRFR